jgi:hypothetical protein
VQLILPLDGERRRAEDEHPLDGGPESQLLDEEPGHDRLAGPGIVGEEEAEPALREQALVDRFELMGERVDAAQADREVGVEGIRKPDARRFDQEEEVLRIEELRRLDGRSKAGLVDGDLLEAARPRPYGEQVKVVRREDLLDDDGVNEVVRQAHAPMQGPIGQASCFRGPMLSSDHTTSQPEDGPDPPGRVP